MRGVTIADREKGGAVLSFDLIDILRLLGPEGEGSDWEVAELECTGSPSADELQRLAEGNGRLSGRTLLQLAAGTQVIDGVFSGYRGGDAAPWVRVRAVDSTAFDVESDDDAVLGRLKECFEVVSDWDSSPAG